MKQKHIKLLILEDEPAHAEVLRRQLADQDGCNVTLASTLSEFNRIISVIEPDLVIADMNLPDGNALSLLNGNSDSQPWPVLLMTSHGDEELAVRALKSGALDYIVKSPETFSNIKHVVNRNIREWHNIQKSKKAEAALKESERKFRSLFVTMAQGVIYWDATGNFIDANPAAEKILGISFSQMKSRSASDYRWGAIHEDGIPFTEEEFPVRQALKTGKYVKNITMGMYHPREDEYKWINISAIPQFHENGNNPFQVFTTFYDITELKKTQAALEQQNLELKEAKERAEESDRLKSAFMANMSHEIRTPMNGILGFADLLKSPNLSGESQQKYIDIIEMSGRRMLDIINDLIDISRIESGQVEVKKEVVNVPELLEELYEFFKPEAKNRGIELKLNLQLPSRKYSIETDRTKLAQIVTNLLKNALKFTAKNGFIELGITSPDYTHLYFYVKDNGMGVRKELQDKIFDRFRQGDISRTEVHEGVGLGLSITKALVEMLGGQIGIESEPGKGSTFYFTLPNEGQLELSDGKADEEEELKEPLQGVNILIAEDDQPSYMLLREVLKRNKINSLHANNGKDAVDLMKRHQNIDLVLMDVKMPVMDGLEATQEIKKINAEIPIIAQSAFVNETDIRNAIEAGCNDYITKPIRINELLNKISEYVLK